MKLLLDTHILLWYCRGVLPPKSESLVHNRANALFFSPASIWEVVTKYSLGRADFQTNPTILYERLLEDDCQEIALTSRHMLGVRALPNIHKDPFDRILLAQAITEGMSLLTSDTILAQYPHSVIYVGR